MKFFDFTFPSAAENLACDEALLDFFEEHGGDGVLRFWESTNYFVVVGYANEVAKEANTTACEAGGIPILRRCSGGGTVLQGPGCLNYSLVAPIGENGPMSTITAANKFIMERNRVAVERCLAGGKSLSEEKEQRLVTSSPTHMTVEIRGHTDLALVSHDSMMKFSGNAQRRKKNFLLFHGTFLLNFDLPLIEKFLCMPSKEPDYRHGRSHKNFLTNLDLPAQAVKEALREVWFASEPMENVPHDAIGLLARDKYVTKGWNLKF